MDDSFGDRLRSERKRLLLTQIEIAKLGGVTVQSYRYYESGRRSPNIAFLSAIAKRDVEINFIFLITGDRSKESRNRKQFATTVHYLKQALTTALNEVEHAELRLTKFNHKEPPK